MSSIEKITGYTGIDTAEKCDFTWVIDDFIMIREKVQSFIMSPIFRVGSNQWKFQLSLLSKYSILGKSIDYSKLHIRCCEQTENLLYAYKISIIKDDKIVYTQMDCQKCDELLSFIEIFKISTEEMDKFISLDAIIFHCELKVSTGSVTSLLNTEPSKIDQVLPPKLKFDWIFLDEGLSDVELRTKCGKEIPAHRVVLAAASPVFKAMFNHNMLENQSQSVNMIDISYEAAVEMLRYIYTGSVETCEFQLTTDLLAAADKYQLEELKNKCGAMLCSSISAGHAIETLSIAVKYNMDCLKQIAADFIKLHINEL